MTEFPVVYITEAPPWPAQSGGHLRTSGNLHALAALGPTHLLMFPSSDRVLAKVDGLPQLASMTTITVHRPGARARVRERAKATARLRQTYLERFEQAGGLDIARRTIEEVGARVVVLEYPFYPWLAESLRRPGVSFVGDVADDRVGVALSTLRARAGVPWRDRLRALADLPALVQSESHIDRLDQAWFAAPAEAERARSRHPGLDVRVVPNIVPLDRLATYRSIPATSYSAAFLGMFSYPPNAVAAVRFADGIAPLLRSRYPGCELAVIGRSPTPRVRVAAARGGVRLFEDVPDATEVLRRYATLVVPLTFGAGTRLKILEALAAGVPVVSTKVGVAGLALRAGEHVLVGSTDHELADRVVELWERPELGQTMVGAAEGVLRRRYSQHSLTAAVTDALSSIPARRA